MRVLAWTSILLFGVALFADGEEVRLGDVSDNGEITAYDALLILQHVVGGTTLSERQLAAADVSGRGGVTAYDAALILQFVVGIIDRFPAYHEIPEPRPVLTFYLDPDTYVPTGEILIGEGRLYPVWSEPLDVQIPFNRPTWAMALAHSYQIFRNVIGIEFPINAIFATAIKESRLGFDPDVDVTTAAEDPAFTHPITYHTINIRDGFFQIESTTAYNELIRMYDRFDNVSHADVIGGTHFETSAIAKIYYDMFAVRFIQNKGYRPIEFFQEATDRSAMVKAISGVYNRGLWSYLVEDIFNRRRSEALATADLLTIFHPNSIEKDHAWAISNYTLVLSDSVDRLPADLQPNNLFRGYYDAQISWEDIADYIDKIMIIYPEVEQTDVEEAASEAFSDIAGGRNSISFRTEFGKVLDAIMLTLPVDDPMVNVKAWYGQ